MTTARLLVASLCYSSSSVSRWLEHRLGGALPAARLIGCLPAGLLDGLAGCLLACWLPYSPARPYMPEFLNAGTPPDVQPCHITARRVST